MSEQTTPIQENQESTEHPVNDTVKISSNIFNLDKDDYGNRDLFLGQQMGLLDTINRPHDEIHRLYKKMKSQDWDENEFDYTSCNAEFKACSKGMYEAMIYNLAYQWEADTVASRSIVSVLAPFITNSELWSATLAIGTNEVLHCLEPGHEVITRDGFKRISEITTDDEVLQWSPETKIATFTKPMEVINKAYKGKMYDYVDSYGVTIQSVTPEHRMPIREYNGKVTSALAQDHQYGPTDALPRINLPVFYEDDFVECAGTIVDNYLDGTEIGRQEYLYEGRVYCLRVPDTYFFVRKNNHVTVTGNSLTYSEIVRNSFDNPDDVFKDILEIVESFQRMEPMAKVFDEAYTVSHQYALDMVSKEEAYEAIMLFYAALYCLERIQFISSFAVTFAFGNIGMFMPIAKAVQKICQDEYEVHVKLDAYVIKNELTTPRGQAFLLKNHQRVSTIITSIVNAELAWSDFLGQGDRELPGLTSEKLRDFVLYHSKPVYDSFGLTFPFNEIKENPLPFTEEWMNINLIQASPQEEKGRNSSYLLGMVFPRNSDKIYDTTDL